MRSIGCYLAPLVVMSVPLYAQTGGRESAHYVAYTVRVASSRAAYVSYLRDNALPVWTALQTEGLLASRLVLMVDSVATAAVPEPSWHALHLARIAPGIEPRRFLQAERARFAKMEFARPGAEVLRVEILESTPRSFYTVPAAPQADRGDVEYFVEYINAYDGFLNEYRESMIRNSGPAIGRLHAAGLVQTFVALETRSVEYTREDMPPWNQIHVMSTPLNRPWPADAFDAALRAVNPRGGGYATVFGRLDDIRNKPRETVCREVTSLTIHLPR